MNGAYKHIAKRTLLKSIYFTVFIIGGFMTSALSAFSQSNYRVMKWSVLDMPFKVSKPSDQPFDIVFGARFLHESGKELNVPGFYNGERNYVIRVTLEEEGNWSYQTYSSDSALSGLGGNVEVTKITKSDEHGPVVISADNPHKFSYADGTPYYLLAFELDWLFALDWENAKGIPKTERIVGHIKDNGFNQIIMNVYAYDAQFGDREHIAAGDNYSEPGVFPFGGTNESPDYTTLNVWFFKHLDRVIAHLEDQEIIAHLMIYVWNKKVSWPDPDSEADNRYFDYVVKRYQAYPNVVWDISKEALGYGHDDMDYITERINRLKKIDGHNRLLSVHDYAYCSANPEKVDFISIQEWRPNLYDKMSEGLQKHVNKPLFNIEHGGYEKSMHSIYDGAYNDPVVCLDRNYKCAFAGAYSTYYWQNSSWYEVVVEPFELPKQNQPKFSYYKHMANLFEIYDYNKLQPDQRFFNSYYLTDHETTYIFYLTNDAISISGKAKDLKGKTGRFTWLDPISGQYVPGEEKTFEGNWVSFKKPDLVTSPIAVAILEIL